jgi:ABC-type phosphate transport system permease subunit
VVLAGVPAVIMGFIALIEAIVYLTRSDEEFERLYVKGNKSWF